MRSQNFLTDKNFHIKKKKKRKKKVSCRHFIIRCIQQQKGRTLGIKLNLTVFLIIIYSRSLCHFEKTGRHGKKRQITPTGFQLLHNVFSKKVHEPLVLLIKVQKPPLHLSWKVQNLRGGALDTWINYIPFFTHTLIVP